LDVTQRRLIVTDFLGQPMGAILKGQAAPPPPLKNYLTVMDVDWNNLARDREVTGCYEQGNELPYTIMYAKFCDRLMKCKFLKNDFCSTDLASCVHLRYCVTS
jgi:hypothetical protein